MLNRESQHYKLILRIVHFLFILTVYWHYFFSAVYQIRMNARLFWPIAAVMSIILIIEAKAFLKINIYELLILISFIYITGCLVIFNLPMSSQLISIILFFIVARGLTLQKFEVKYLIHIIYAFAGVMLIFTFIQFLLPDFFTNNILKLLSTVYKSRILGFMSRKAFTGLTTQTSSNAAMLVFGLGAAVFSLYISGKLKIFHAINIMFFLCGLILTAKRGPLIIVLFLLTIFMLVNYKYKKKQSIYLLGVLMMVTCLIITIYCIGSTPLVEEISITDNHKTTIETSTNPPKNEKLAIINKTNNTISEDDISNGRFDLWKSTLKKFIQKPVFGYGYDTFSINEGYDTAHNTYIHVLYEQGIVGFVVFFLPHLYVLYISLKFLFGYIKKKKDVKNIVFWVIQYSLFIQLYYFIASLLSGVFQNKLWMLVLFITQYIVVNKNSKHRGVGVLHKRSVK